MIRNTFIAAAATLCSLSVLASALAFLQVGAGVPVA